MQRSQPRVLVVTSSYPTPAAPVAGAFVREHALAAARVAEVGVLHLERTRGLRVLRIEAERDGRLPLWRVRYPWAPRAVSAAGLLAGAAAGLRAARRAGFRPDLLHAHLLPAAIPTVALGRAVRLPTVVSEHWSVFLPEDPLTLAPPIRLAAKLALERAAYVLPVSAALARAIEAHGIHPRLRVVPNVVDTELFHPGSPRPPGSRLLAVALFYPAKGIDLLLQALPAVRGDWTLDLVGDGDERSAYEELARRESAGASSSTASSRRNASPD